MRVLAMDAKSGRFTEFAHPEGRTITLIQQRPDGGAWVASEAKGVPGSRLEVYDGASFQKVLELGREWQGSSLRCVLERGKGEIWLGGYPPGAASIGTASCRIRSSPATATRKPASSPWQPAHRRTRGRRPGPALEIRRQVLDRDARWPGPGPALGHRARRRSVGGYRHGVHRFKDGSWIGHQVEEGLPAVIAFTVFQDSRGRFVAGTARGLALYHPETETDLPRTILRSATNLHEVSPSGEARIAFSGIDKWNHTPSERLLFSYRLDGGMWSPFEVRDTATYHRLRAGTHRFEVRAMDRSGHIDPAGQSLDFAVPLVWYRQFGFLALLGGGRWQPSSFSPGSPLPS